jgi:hypothetical protein
MSAKPDRTLITAQNVIEYLWDLLCKKRYCRIENDFQFGYDRALNDMWYYLIYTTREPERSVCAECAVEGHKLTTVEDVLDYLFCDIQDMRNHPPEGDFQQGYERAINDLMYQVWLASPESAKSKYFPQKWPERCTEGAKVIDLADARRNLGNQGSNVGDLMHQVSSASPKSAKSEYVLRKIPAGCSEGAKVINLADARRDRGDRSSKGDQG